MTKTLPRDLTSYDLLKALAVMLMIVDHVGYYFYPDDNWWRVAGRLCVPIWFFLIGYARSRDTGKRLWIGCSILLAANVPAGMSILPANIMATMLFVRMALDPFLKHALKSRRDFWAGIAFLFILAIPTSLAVEYGTHALIMAIYGWVMRNKDDARVPGGLPQQYLAFALISFVALQELFFGFSAPQFRVLALGITAVMTALYFFRPLTFPRLTKALPFPLTGLLKIMGRRTLEIYVLHLLLLKLMGVMLEPERFVFMDWKLLSPTGV